MTETRGATAVGSRELSCIGPLLELCYTSTVRPRADACPLRGMTLSNASPPMCEQYLTGAAPIDSNPSHTALHNPLVDPQIPGPVASRAQVPADRLAPLADRGVPSRDFPDAGECLPHDLRRHPSSPRQFQGPAQHRLAVSSALAQIVAHLLSVNTVPRQRFAAEPHLAALRRKTQPQVPVLHSAPLDFKAP